MNHNADNYLIGKIRGFRGHQHSFVYASDDQDDSGE